VHVDDANSHPRTIYLNALLHQPEVARLPFPERPDGVSFAEMYVDQTVVEEQRERQPAPVAEADTARALHGAMIREVVRQVEVDLWQALTERSRVVVEAPAWTGKSTLCRWVTHQCYARTAWLPILIPFRDFVQSEKSLRQYLDEDYTAWLGLPEQPLTVELSDGSQQTRTVGHWLDDEWQAGKALVILDGVDEEFVPERRERALGFLPATQDCAVLPRVLLTSRPLGASAPGFAQVKLQEFIPQQTDRLVRQCGAIMKAPDKAEQFLKDMQSIENLRARPLAGRPGHLVWMLAAYVQDGVLLSAEDDLMQYMAERRLALTRGVTPLLQPDDLSYKRQVVEALAFHLLFCRRGQAQNDTQMLSLVRQTLREVKVNGTPVYTARDGGTVLEDLCRNSELLKQTRRSAYETYE